MIGELRARGLKQPTTVWNETLELSVGIFLAISCNILLLSVSWKGSGAWVKGFSRVTGRAATAFISHRAHFGMESLGDENLEDWAHCPPASPAAAELARAQGQIAQLQLQVYPPSDVRDIIIMQTKGSESRCLIPPPLHRSAISRQS